MRGMSIPPHRPFDSANQPATWCAHPQGAPLLHLWAGESSHGWIHHLITKGWNNSPPQVVQASDWWFTCIVHSPLNDITIKNRYPLPFISSVSELLKKTVVFTRLDLWNEYHLRGGDEWKTGFNTSNGQWWIPGYAFGSLQCSSSFANICKLSFVCVPQWHSYFFSRCRDSNSSCLWSLPNTIRQSTKLKIAIFTWLLSLPGLHHHSKPDSNVPSWGQCCGRLANPRQSEKVTAVFELY